MSLRFASQLCIDNLPDEQLEDQFEVIMPEIELLGTSGSNGNMLERFAGSVGLYTYAPIVEEIVFSQMKFKTETRRVRMGYYNFPSDMDKWDDVSITMFCSASMTTQLYLDAWKALMYNKDGEYFEPASKYKKNIEVYINGPSTSGTSSVFGDVVSPRSHYTLVGCFPKSQDPYKLRYTDDPQRFRILAHFSVDKVVHDLSTAKAAVVNEMVKSPTSLLDKGLTSLTSSNSTYDITKTYS